MKMMQVTSSLEEQDGGTVVKRLSVPVGLEELMTGLTKEVLQKKPSDIYNFASEHFAQLLALRDNRNYQQAPTKSITYASKEDGENLLANGRLPPTKSFSGTPSKLSRQVSIRASSPTRKAGSKIKRSPTPKHSDNNNNNEEKIKEKQEKKKPIVQRRQTPGNKSRFDNLEPVQENALKITTKRQGLSRRSTDRKSKTDSESSRDSKRSSSEESEKKRKATSREASLRRKSMDKKSQSGESQETKNKKDDYKKLEAKKDETKKVNVEEDTADEDKKASHSKNFEKAKEVSSLGLQHSGEIHDVLILKESLKDKAEDQKISTADENPQKGLPSGEENAPDKFIPKSSSVEESVTVVKDGRLTVTPPKILKEAQVSPDNFDVATSLVVPVLAAATSCLDHKKSSQDQSIAVCEQATSTKPEEGNDSKTEDSETGEIVDSPKKEAEDESASSKQYDPSVLRQELQKAEEDAKINNFTSSYNPYKLRKDIKNVSKYLEEGEQEEDKSQPLANAEPTEDNSKLPEDSVSKEKKLKDAEEKESDESHVKEDVAVKANINNTDISLQFEASGQPESSKRHLLHEQTAVSEKTTGSVDKTSVEDKDVSQEDSLGDNKSEKAPTPTMTGSSVSSGTVSGLQHSGELHDQLIPKEVTEENPVEDRSATNSKKFSVNEVSADSSSRGLQHSGELHDLLVPEETSEDKLTEEKNASGAESKLAPEVLGKTAFLGLQHSGELHESLIPEETTAEDKHESVVEKTADEKLRKMVSPDLQHRRELDDTPIQKTIGDEDKTVKNDELQEDSFSELHHSGELHDTLIPKETEAAHKNVEDKKGNEESQGKPDADIADHSKYLVQKTSEEIKTKAVGKLKKEISENVAKVGPGTVTDEIIMQAATKIQAGVRGYLTRKQHKDKTASEETLADTQTKNATVSVTDNAHRDKLSDEELQEVLTQLESIAVPTESPHTSRHKRETSIPVDLTDIKMEDSTKTKPETKTEKEKQESAAKNASGPKEEQVSTAGDKLSGSKTLHETKLGKPDIPDFSKSLSVTDSAISRTLDEEEEKLRDSIEDTESFEHTEDLGIESEKSTTLHAETAAESAEKSKEKTPQEAAPGVNLEHTETMHDTLIPKESETDLGKLENKNDMEKVDRQEAELLPDGKIIKETQVEISSKEWTPDSRKEPQLASKVSLRHSGELHDLVIPKETEKTSQELQENINGEITSLQHSGELHDLLIPKEAEGAIQDPQKNKTLDTRNLQHSGELHDLLIPKESLQELQNDKNLMKDHLQHRGEPHDLTQKETEEIQHEQKVGECLEIKKQLDETSQKTEKDRNLEAQNLQHSGELHDVVILKEIAKTHKQAHEIDNLDLENIQLTEEVPKRTSEKLEKTGSVKEALQHSGELHDFVIPKETQKNLQNKNDGRDLKIESLRHSGELHDLLIPKEISQKSPDYNNLIKDNLQHSGEFHDLIIPKEVGEISDIKDYENVAKDAEKNLQDLQDDAKLVDNSWQHSGKLRDLVIPKELEETHQDAKEVKNLEAEIITSSKELPKDASQELQADANLVRDVLQHSGELHDVLIPKETEKSSLELQDDKQMYIQHTEQKQDFGSPRKTSQQNYLEAQRLEHSGELHDFLIPKETKETSEELQNDNNAVPMGEKDTQEKAKERVATGNLQRSGELHDLLVPKESETQDVVEGQTINTIKEVKPLLEDHQKNSKESLVDEKKDDKQNQQLGEDAVDRKGSPDSTTQASGLALASGLQHSGELHDLLIPKNELPLEFQAKEDKAEVLEEIKQFSASVLSATPTKELPKLVSTDGLQHSGEMHDHLILKEDLDKTNSRLRQEESSVDEPEATKEETIGDATKDEKSAPNIQALLSENESNPQEPVGLQHTGELHDVLTPEQTKTGSKDEETNEIKPLAPNQVQTVEVAKVEYSESENSLSQPCTPSVLAESPKIEERKAFATPSLDLQHDVVAGEFQAVENKSPLLKHVQNLERASFTLSDGLSEQILDQELHVGTPKTEKFKFTEQTPINTQEPAAFEGSVAKTTEKLNDSSPHKPAKDQELTGSDKDKQAEATKVFEEKAKSIKLKETSPEEKVFDISKLHAELEKAGKQEKLYNETLQNRNGEISKEPNIVKQESPNKSKKDTEEEKAKDEKRKDTKKDERKSFDQPDNSVKEIEAQISQDEASDTMNLGKDGILPENDKNQTVTDANEELDKIKTEDSNKVQANIVEKSEKLKNKRREKKIADKKGKTHITIQESVKNDISQENLQTRTQEELKKLESKNADLKEKTLKAVSGDDKADKDLIKTLNVVVEKQETEKMETEEEKTQSALHGSEKRGIFEEGRFEIAGKLNKTFDMSKLKTEIQSTEKQEPQNKALKDDTLKETNNGNQANKNLNRFSEVSIEEQALPVQKVEKMNLEEETAPNYNQKDYIQGESPVKDNNRSSKAFNISKLHAELQEVGKQEPQVKDTKEEASEVVSGDDRAKENSFKVSDVVVEKHIQEAKDAEAENEKIHSTLTESQSNDIPEDATRSNKVSEITKFQAEIQNGAKQEMKEATTADNVAEAKKEIQKAAVEEHGKPNEKQPQSGLREDQKSESPEEQILKDVSDVKKSFDISELRAELDKAGKESDEDKIVPSTDNSNVLNKDEGKVEKIEKADDKARNAVEESQKNKVQETESHDDPNKTFNIFKLRSELKEAGKETSEDEMQTTNDTFTNLNEAKKETQVGVSEKHEPSRDLKHVDDKPKEEKPTTEEGKTQNTVSENEEATTPEQLEEAKKEIEEDKTEIRANVSKTANKFGEREVQEGIAKQHVESLKSKLLNENEQKIKDKKTRKGKPKNEDRKDDNFEETKVSHTSQQASDTSKFYLELKEVGKQPQDDKNETSVDSVVSKINAKSVLEECDKASKEHSNEDQNSADEGGKQSGKGKENVSQTASTDKVEEVKTETEADSSEEKPAEDIKTFDVSKLHSELEEVGTLEKDDSKTTGEKIAKMKVTAFKEIGENYGKVSAEKGEQNKATLDEEKKQTKITTHAIIDEDKQTENGTAQTERSCSEKKSPKDQFKTSDTSKLHLELEKVGKTEAESTTDDEIFKINNKISEERGDDGKNIETKQDTLGKTPADEKEEEIKTKHHATADDDQELEDGKTESELGKNQDKDSQEQSIDDQSDKIKDESTTSDTEFLQTNDKNAEETHEGDEKIIVEQNEPITGVNGEKIKAADADENAEDQRTRPGDKPKPFDMSKLHLELQEAGKQEKSGNVEATADSAYTNFEKTGKSVKKGQESLSSSEKVKKLSKTEAKDPESKTLDSEDRNKEVFKEGKEKYVNITSQEKAKAEENQVIKTPTSKSNSSILALSNVSTPLQSADQNYENSLTDDSSVSIYETAPTRPVTSDITPNIISNENIQIPEDDLHKQVQDLEQYNPEDITKPEIGRFSAEKSDANVALESEKFTTDANVEKTVTKQEKAKIESSVKPDDKHKQEGEIEIIKNKKTAEKTSGLIKNTETFTNDENVTTVGTEQTTCNDKDDKMQTEEEKERPVSITSTASTDSGTTVIVVSPRYRDDDAKSSSGRVLSNFSEKYEKIENDTEIKDKVLENEVSAEAKTEIVSTEEKGKNKKETETEAREKPKEENKRKEEEEEDDDDEETNSRVETGNIFDMSKLRAEIGEVNKEDGELKSKGSKMNHVNSKKIAKEIQEVAEESNENSRAGRSETKPGEFEQKEDESEVLKVQTHQNTKKNHLRGKEKKPKTQDIVVSNTHDTSGLKVEEKLIDGMLKNEENLKNRNIEISEKILKTRHAAATKIQSNYRGYCGRRDLNRNSSSTPQEKLGIFATEQKKKQSSGNSTDADIKDTSLQHASDNSDGEMISVPASDLQKVSPVLHGFEIISKKSTKDSSLPSSLDSQQMETTEDRKNDGGAKTEVSSSGKKSESKVNTVIADVPSKESSLTPSLDFQDPKVSEKRKSEAASSTKHSAKHGDTTDVVAKQKEKDSVFGRIETEDSCSENENRIKGGIKKEEQNIDTEPGLAATAPPLHLLDYENDSGLVRQSRDDDSDSELLKQLLQEEASASDPYKHATAPPLILMDDLKEHDWQTVAQLKTKEPIKSVEPLEQKPLQLQKVDEKIQQSVSSKENETEQNFFEEPQEITSKNQETRTEQATPDDDSKSSGKETTPVEPTAALVPNTKELSAPKNIEETTYLSRFSEDSNYQQESLKIPKSPKETKETKEVTSTSQETAAKQTTSEKKSQMSGKETVLSTTEPMEIVTSVKQKFLASEEVNTETQQSNILTDREPLQDLSRSLKSSEKSEEIQNVDETEKAHTIVPEKFIVGDLKAKPKDHATSPRLHSDHEGTVPKALGAVLNQQLAITAPRAEEKQKSVESEGPEYIYIPLKDPANTSTSPEPAVSSKPPVFTDYLTSGLEHTGELHDTTTIPLLNLNKDQEPETHADVNLDIKTDHEKESVGKDRTTLVPVIEDISSSKYDLVEGGISPRARGEEEGTVPKALSVVLDQQLAITAPHAKEKQDVQTESPEYIYIPLKDPAEPSTSGLQHSGELHDTITAPLLTDTQKRQNLITPATPTDLNSETKKLTKSNREQETEGVEENIADYSKYDLVEEGKSPRIRKEQEEAVPKALGVVLDQQLAITAPSGKIREEEKQDSGDPKYIYIPLKDPNEFSTSEELINKFQGESFNKLPTSEKEKPTNRLQDKDLNQLATFQDKELANGLKNQPPHFQEKEVTSGFLDKDSSKPSIFYDHKLESEDSNFQENEPTNGIQNIDPHKPLVSQEQAGTTKSLTLKEEQLANGHLSKEQQKNGYAVEESCDSSTSKKQELMNGFYEKESGRSLGSPKRKGFNRFSVFKEEKLGGGAELTNGQTDTEGAKSSTSDDRILTNGIQNTDLQTSPTSQEREDSNKFSTLNEGLLDGLLDEHFNKPTSEEEDVKNGLEAKDTMLDKNLATKLSSADVKLADETDSKPKLTKSSGSPINLSCKMENLACPCPSPNSPSQAKEEELRSPTLTVQTQTNPGGFLKQPSSQLQRSSPEDAAAGTPTVGLRFRYSPSPIQNSEKHTEKISPSPESATVSPTSDTKEDQVKTSAREDRSVQSESSSIVIQSAQISDSTMPLAVQLNQPPAGAAALTSPTSQAGGDAGASVSASPGSAHAPAKGASTKVGAPKSSAHSRTSMETGKRKNATIARKNMEEVAATKIQASFRGYQVRKQLKIKNGGVESMRRSLRRKSSGKFRGSDKASQKPSGKPSDLEEKSATKIQAGIRGFLVRRRQQKKAKNNTTPESS